MWSFHGKWKEKNGIISTLWGMLHVVITWGMKRKERKSYWGCVVCIIIRHTSIWSESCFLIMIFLIVRTCKPSAYRREIEVHILINNHASDRALFTSKTTLKPFAHVSWKQILNWEAFIGRNKNFLLEELVIFINNSLENECRVSHHLRERTELGL